LLLTQREAGAAVLLVSEELEELLSLSDRVYVIYEGKIMGEVQIGSGEPDESLVDMIGQMMTGTPLDQIQKEGAAAHD
jgi:simple sugar transport system ATP-binding protein